MLRSTWRLLDYRVEDPRMNLAINEALLRSREEKSGIDTIRLWENSKAVVLGALGNIESEVCLDACDKHRVVLTRSICACPTHYDDMSSLNFTIILSEKSFPISKNLLSIYKLFYESVTRTFSNFSVETKVDDYGRTLLAERGKVCEAGIRFLNDIMMFHGTIYVDTNLEIAKDVLKRNGTALTSLGKEARTIIPMEEMKRLLTEDFEKTLSITLEEKGITDQERTLAQRLHEKKYSKHDWNVEGKEPLSLSDILIEVYVAYPPTSKCREIMNVVSKVEARYRDKVEVRTWMRGAGLRDRGRVGDIVMSAALRKAAKDSIVPAVIINGDMVFERTVPLEDQLADVVSGLLP